MIFIFIKIITTDGTLLTKMPGDDDDPPKRLLLNTRRSSHWLLALPVLTWWNCPSQNITSQSPQSSIVFFRRPPVQLRMPPWLCTNSLFGQYLNLDENHVSFSFSRWPLVPSPRHGPRTPPPSHAGLQSSSASFMGGSRNICTARRWRYWLLARMFNYLAQKTSVRWINSQNHQKVIISLSSQLSS